MSRTVTADRFTRLSLAFSGLIMSALLSASALAHERTLFLVEEDWEMTVNDPEPNNNSPQVAFFMYPDADHADCYFQLQMNYAAEDQYSSGGFRVGAFCNEAPVDEERSVVRESLAWSNDKLTWTNAMAVFNGKLMFALKDGRGVQWGTFGGPAYLVEMDDQELHSLEHYSPENSIAAVDIGFGANRVSSIRLKRVRLRYTDGSTQTLQINRLIQK